MRIYTSGYKRWLGGSGYKRWLVKIKVKVDFNVCDCSSRIEYGRESTTNLPGSVLVGGGYADEVDGEWMGEASLVQRLGVTQTVGRRGC